MMTPGDCSNQTEKEGHGHGKLPGPKYSSIHEVIEDCRRGKRVYLRGFLSAGDVVMQATVVSVLGMVERGQIRRAGE